MTHYICQTCGTQYPASETPPESCPICEDERQYIGWNGQQWTTLEVLLENHHNEIKEEEPGLTGVGTQPSFAIGQRALLVQTPQGNTLWDCLTVLEPATVEALNAAGWGASDCYFAPALLLNDDRVEPGIRCADLPARGRPPARDAPGPGDPLLGGRDTNVAG